MSCKDALNASRRGTGTEVEVRQPRSGLVGVKASTAISRPGLCPKTAPQPFASRLAGPGVTHNADGLAHRCLLPRLCHPARPASAAAPRRPGTHFCRELSVARGFLHPSSRRQQVSRARARPTSASVCTLQGLAQDHSRRSRVLAKEKGDRVGIGGHQKVHAFAGVTTRSTNLPARTRGADTLSQARWVSISVTTTSRRATARRPSRRTRTSCCSSSCTASLPAAPTRASTRSS